MTDFDFGFTAMDEGELDVVQKASTAAETATATATSWEEKCNALYNAYKPLLNNLAKNPEKDYIYWPNRLDKLESFSDMIDGIYKG
jgi:Tfp pilus assembly protein PilX